MIKASSLFYALVVSVIIAIISSSLILYAYLSGIQFNNFEREQHINLNADSGINLLLAQQSLVELNQEKYIDLYGNREDSVLLSRKLWGAYEIVISKAVFKKYEVLRMAQIAYYPDSSDLYCLYLTDKDKPLALCGNTVLKGDAFLPAAGIKRAYIEGQSFKGARLVDGNIKKSKMHLPTFNKNLLDNMEAILSKKIIAENDSVVAIQKELSGDTIINSFRNKTLIITSSNLIRISKGLYQGNVLIISDKEIIVSASATLKDIIIAAPRIVFEKECKGNVQAFASDSILVEKNVSLYYPSVLGIVKDDKSLNTSAIVLNENDTIMGNIFASKNMNDPFKQVLIQLHEKSVVTGQIYSKGYVDAKGIIKGSILCDGIILNTSSSVYENHLLNVVIDITALSKHFASINLLEESTAKKIVKWIR